MVVVALNDLVRAVVRQRMPVEQTDSLPKVAYLAGERDLWAPGLQQARQLGIDVLGIIEDSEDLLSFEGVSVLRRNGLPPLLPCPLLFAGSPRKHQFTRSTRYNQVVLWLNGDQVRKLRSRHADPHMLSRCGDRLADLYTQLADDSSRRTLLSVIASRVHDDNGYLWIAEYSEYMHPTVHVRTDDVVVDAGAHVGKVSRYFGKKVGRGGHVYAFEPDPGNAEEFRHRNSDMPYVELVQAGVWNRPDYLHFDNSSSTSAGFALRESGSTAVPVTSLDVFFGDRAKRPPSLVKLDVEGAELQAIHGAAEMLRTHKPRLMVSVYHNADDIWTLAEAIKSIRPDYKLYLGHHNYYHTETDLYAI